MSPAISFPHTVQLTPHPSGPLTSVRALEVRIDKGTGGALALRYSVHGNMALLRVPPPREARRAAGLWQHTCFEAFLAGSRGPGYCEFNLAPSGEWAVYSFDAYRHGMTAASDTAPPAVTCRVTAELVELHAALDLQGLPPQCAAAPLRLGLAAVLEARDGSLSYWALKHPQGAPDFHHQQGFALDL